MAKRGKGRPKGSTMSRTTWLKNLKERFGEEAFQMLMDYPDSKVLTQTEIAKFIGVSRERVRQILERLYGEDF